MRHHDMNLLVYLDLLVRHGSATRVAEVLGVSQPAVSAAIRRLRSMTEHPLFVRNGRELAPTAYAVSLQQQFAPLLRQWQMMVDREAGFDPAVSDRCFSILASDYTQYLFLPLLARRLARQAPGVSLRVIPSNPYRGVQLIEQQQVDLGIGYYRNVPSQLRQRRVLEEPAVCVLASAHPALDCFDERAYADAGHIAITVENAAYNATLDRVLAAHQIKRRIAIAMPSYVSAAHVVEETEYVATLPRSIAEFAAKTAKIAIRPCTVELPLLDLSMLYHASTETDAASQWFQRVVLECAEEIASSWVSEEQLG